MCNESVPVLIKQPDRLDRGRFFLETLGSRDVTVRVRHEYLQSMAEFILSAEKVAPAT